MKIYATEKNETHKSGIELLKKNGHTVIFDLKKNKPADIDVLFIRTYTNATKEYLSQFTNLKYVLRVGVGLDNVDLDECKRRKITVINAPGSNANAVAEYVLGVAIMGLRSIPFQTNRLHEKEWRDKTHIGSEIKNKVIGIVGCGAIGRLIAKKLQNFEVKNILGYDPYLTEEQMKAAYIQKTELGELIKNSDIITLHMPLTPETKNMISKKTFSQMKKNTVLINAARGGIINEIDLVEALKSKKIKAAALDVFENEPNVRKELLELDNLICTPHIAGFTQEADEEMARMPARKFLEMIQ